MAICLETLVCFPYISQVYDIFIGNHDSIKAIGQNVPSKEDKFALSVVPSGTLVKYEKVVH